MAMYSTGKNLDLVFTIDSTCSMGPYITEAQKTISHIVQTISNNSHFNVRLGLIEYRDHPPQSQDFVTKKHGSGFTTSGSEMQLWLNKVEAYGGGSVVDVCFVMDSSGSIGDDDFQNERDFVKSVAEEFDLDSGHVQVAVVNYSYDSEIAVPLKQHSTVQFQRCVESVGYQCGSTNTSSALDTMCSVLMRGRSGAQKIGILITDGGSDDYNSTVTAASSAKQKGIKMISIGVGTGVSNRELQHVATSSNLVYTVDNFNGLEEIKQRVASDAATGSTNIGGDEPEAVEDGLYEALQLWTGHSSSSSSSKDARVCVLIADQPPHGLANDMHDNHPLGCPDGHDPLEIANQLAENGVTIYVVGCEPSICPYRDFFMAIARITGGLYIPLADSENLSHVIVGVAQEEISLRELMDIVEDEVKKEYTRNKGVVDEEGVSRALYGKLKARKTKQLQMNGGSLPKISAKAKRYARFDKITNVKRKFGVGTKDITASMGTNATFTVVDKEIDITQVQRMVQKAIMINHLEDTRQEEY